MKMLNSSWLMLTVFVLTVLSDSSVLGVNPGFKTRLTQKGLNYLKDVGIGILKKEMKTLRIPDISGNADTKMGNVDYRVSNMRVTSFNIPSATLTPKPNIGGLVLYANGSSLAMTGDWEYEGRVMLLPVKDHGTFDVTASEISLQVAIRIGMDSSGRPTVSSQSFDCAFNIGSLQINFHGGLSWIYNWFENDIACSLKMSLFAQVCKLILKEVNGDLAKEVATLKVVPKIDDIAEIDYSLLSPPNLQGSINMANKGEVFPIGKRDEAPFPVPSIPRDHDTSSMLELRVTQFMLQSAGYVYFKAGFFQYNLTQDKLPRGSKISLNTSSPIVQKTIPQASKLFPNMLMQVNVNASRSPDVAIKPDSVSGTAEMDAVFYVQLPNKSLHYLCTIQLTAYFTAVLRFQGGNICWKAHYANVDVKLLESNIGKIDLMYMKDAVHAVNKILLLPWLNGEGRQGIPLPSLDDVHSGNPVFKLEQGYFKLGLGLRYDGTK